MSVKLNQYIMMLNEHCKQLQQTTQQDLKHDKML